MDWQALDELHKMLRAVGDLVDTAPERHESTTRGALAEADWDVLLRAKAIVHRLKLWQQYPEQSPESYLPQGGEDDRVAG